MEKARYNTELYSNLSEPLNNVKPSNFWGSHHSDMTQPYLLFHESQTFEYPARKRLGVVSALKVEIDA